MKKNKFYKLLSENEFVFLDGAMGTMLQAKGLETGGVPELLNLSKPEWLTEIHGAYVAAGSQLVYANTFGANRYKLHNSGRTVAEIIPAAIKNIRMKK